MKKILVILLLFISSVYAEQPSAEKNLVIDELAPVTINGVKLMFLIRGNDLSKPVLLYLHGGPGHSEMVNIHRSTENLLNDCIVVYYDQRGAGLSYDEKIPQSTMTISQFVEDTKAITDYLKKRFKKDKIFLIGHSWGSALGLYTIKKYPDDYYAFIGAGQEVCPVEQEKAGKKWLITKILESGDENEKGMIPEIEKSKFNDRQRIIKYGGNIHYLPPVSIDKLMKSPTYCPERYTGVLIVRSYAFANKVLREYLKMDYISTSQEFKIPVYLFLGRYDYVTPTEPVIVFYDRMKALKKEIIWFEESAHQMDIEESEKFQKSIAKIISNNYR